MEADNNESASDSISIASTDSSSILSAPNQPGDHPPNLAMSWDHIPKKPLTHDDETSEMSISDVSSDSEDHDESASMELDITKMAPASTTSAGIDRKRRLSSSISTTIIRTRSQNGQDTAQKKRKIERPQQSYRTIEGRLSVDRSSLPAELWRHIFIHVPPRTLGRVMRVCKIFRTHLDPDAVTTLLDEESVAQKIRHKRSADELWQASRRAFLPGMPTPMQGKSELAMWRLACGKSCESCGRVMKSFGTENNPWRQGPGESGVRPIWNFSNRLCGSCLSTRSIKEIDLLLSSSVPSALLVALPFIFVTGDEHVVTASLLSQGNQPSNVQVAKHFDKINVNAIKDEFFKVKSMGQGTAEEWLKGLDGRGKDANSDASRWERWEAAGGLQRMRQADTISPIPAVIEALPKSYPTNIAQPLSLPVSEKVAMLPSNLTSHLSRLGSSTQKTALAKSMPQVTVVVGQGHNMSRPVPGPRQERTREEVAALKAARRHDIEERAARLNSPLPSSVLAHMPSFQAAIQIITPFDDRAWELLKPRLLSQRPEAEKREAEIAEQTRLIQEQLNERRNQELQMKEAREAIDREWEDAQEPLRARMAAYADELIKDGWQKGLTVNQETCPKFAADVLLYVRKRFYAEVAKDEAAVRAAGHEPPVDPLNGPFKQKLTLENMKWLFDTKVKPISEQYRKELFLCAACQVNNKYYGFEGVVQHYAAKHTNVLSIGSVVVHWRAEWPDPPPFHQDPITFANTMIPSIAFTGLNHPTTALNPHNLPNGYGSHVPTVGIPSSVGHPHSAPAYVQTGQQPGSMHYRSQYNGSPGAFFQAHGPVLASPYSSAPTNITQQWPSTEHLTHNYQHTAAVNQYAQNLPVAAVAGATYSSTLQPSEPAPLVIPQAQAITPETVQISAQTAVQQPSGIYRSAEYRTQLLSVARAAREAWNTISSVKDIPGSIRVHTVLFFVLKTFRDEYNAEPPLTMLIDGLSNNKDMRPVRNINGLACRACSLEKAYNNNTHARPSKGSHANEKKLLSFPQLLNHFQSQHVVTEKDDVAQFSWTSDMVELPERKKMSLINRAITFNDKQRSMIEEALPEAFTATPEPIPVEEMEQYAPYEAGDRKQSQTELPPSIDKHKHYYTTQLSGEVSDYQDEGDLQEETEALARYLNYNSIQRPLANTSEKPVASHNETTNKHKNTKISATNYPSNVTDAELNQSRMDQVQKPLVPRIISDEVPESRARVASVPDAQLLEFLITRDSANSRASELISQDPHVLRSSHAKPSTSDRYVLRESTDHFFHGPPNPPNPPRRLERPCNLDNGSEDGELRSESIAQAVKRNSTPDQQSAAERFLAEFLPGESSEDYFRKAREAERQGEEALRARYSDEHYNSRDNLTTRQVDAQMMSSRSCVDDEEYVPGMRTLDHRGSSTLAEGTYLSRQPHGQDQSAIMYDGGDHPGYSDQHVRHVRQQAEDVRYLNDKIVYVDNRKSRPTYRNDIETAQVPESAQLISTRVRSRSPLYMTDDGLVRGYRERSYIPHYQEQIYHDENRYPPVAEHAYARVPHREYVSDYVNERPSIDGRHEEELQYIEMEDAQGKYLIRRPVRHERAPLYVGYENDQRLAPSNYMSLPQAIPERAFDEEYDPRNPAPLPPVATRQVHYQ